MEFRSMNELFLDRVKQHHNEPAYQFKKQGRWEVVTWSNFGQTARNLALSFLDLGLGRGDRIAILNGTNPAWDLADRATSLIGGVTVGIYPTLPADQTGYILAHCGARAVAIADAVQLAKIREARSQCPALETLILIDEAGAAGDDWLSFTQLTAIDDAKEKAFGSRLDQSAAAVESGDPATFIYTSGTTGPPKGAILTHANLLHEAEAITNAVPVGPDDTTLCWLPLAHAFQRACTAAWIWMGGKTAYAESVEKLLENLREVRPSVFYGVPRIFEKAYTKIHEQVAAGSPGKQRVFAWSKKVGLEISRCKQQRRPVPLFLGVRGWLADRLVFRKIRDVLGGRVRFFASAGAPIAPEILEFFHAAGVTALEAYGATETSAAITFNLVDDFRFGTVGKAMRGMQIKIAEDGEILVHGPMVFSGYYRDPGQTAEALSPDGWYATGDVGELDADGFLRITDRKKDIIITAAGKNIAPQNIENALKQSLYISQAMVYGDRRKFLTALITLDPETLIPWAKSRNLPTADWSALCAQPQVADLIAAEVARVNAHLARFETVKYHRIIPDDFTVESGELTPTLKVKRKVVTQRYQSLLESMYGE